LRTAQSRGELTEVGRDLVIQESRFLQYLVQLGVDVAEMVPDELRYALVDNLKACQQAAELL
jgi:predicted DNA-binding transcriptional regulator YafY